MRNTLSSLVWGLAICLLALGSLQSFSARATEGYKLGSGDSVKIAVFGEPDLTGTFQIDGSGGVAFPLIGVVPAGGGTARELEEAIERRLKDGYLRDPTVSVEVLTFRPFFILGEVKQPGSYPYKDGLTVLNAVALAGGYTYRAKSNRWLITRGNAEEWQEREIEEGDFRLLPGDTVVIPERFF